MRHFSDQAVNGVTRQPCVGVQCDDVPNIGRHRGCLSVYARVGCVRSAPQQAIELVQLAALALPPKPAPLALIPNPTAVKQKKAVADRGRAVTSIKPGDTV